MATLVWSAVARCLDLRGYKCNDNWKKSLWHDATDKLS